MADCGKSQFQNYMRQNSKSWIDLQKEPHGNFKYEFNTHFINGCMNGYHLIMFTLRAMSKKKTNCMCLEEKTTDFKIVFHEKQEKHEN